MGNLMRPTKGKPLEPSSKSENIFLFLNVRRNTGEGYSVVLENRRRLATETD